MGTRPLVSVIVTFFNAEKFIQEAIESVLAQTYDNWELILVDDLSTDGSAKVVLSYVQKYPGRMQYLTHDDRERMGLSASRNLGIRNAKGEYIALLDADDVWMPGKLEEQAAILGAFPQAAMAYQTAQVWFSWTGNPSDAHRDYMEDLGVSVNTLIGPPTLVSLFLKNEGDTPCPSSIVVRREVAEQVGGFEDAFRGMYEDQVFVCKICLESSVFVASGCGCKYRQHTSSMVMSALSAGQHASARLRFLTWLLGYLEERGIRDSDIMYIVKRQLRVWRLLSALPLLERITYPIARARKLFVWMRPHLKPSLIKARLRSIAGIQPLRPSTRHGLPPHAYYVEQFLRDFTSNAPDNCLKIEHDSGRLILTKVDRLGQSAHEFTEDLVEQEVIHNCSYDRIVCTDVLQKIREPKKLVLGLHRVLRAGGVLLVTVPLIADFGPNDTFRPTMTGLRGLLDDVFGSENVIVGSYGNSLVAAGEMRGMTVCAFTKSELDYYDPRFAIEVWARAVKQ